MANRVSVGEQVAAFYTHLVNAFRSNSLEGSGGVFPCCALWNGRLKALYLQMGAMMLEGAYKGADERRNIA